MRLKKRVKYHGISLPSPLIEEIKDHIKNKREYRSVADFTTHAIRQQMSKERRIEIAREQGRTVIKTGLPKDEFQQDSNLDVDRLFKAVQLFMDKKFDEFEKKIDKLNNQSK